MDQALVDFHRTAQRINQGRQGTRRRYGPALQQQAVAYWRARQAEGQSVPTVATVLGVTPWSLYRWIAVATGPRRFHPVEVVRPAPAPGGPVVIAFDAIGARVEGLDLEGAAALLARLR